MEPENSEILKSEFSIEAGWCLAFTSMSIVMPSDY